MSALMAPPPEIGRPVPPSFRERPSHRAMLATAQQCLRQTFFTDQGPALDAILSTDILKRAPHIAMHKRD